jgi:hypothetical protein
MSYDLSDIFCAIKVVKLVLHSLRRLDHLSDNAFNLVFI